MEKAENKRNYSLDLLRILSMMIIIVLHQMSHGEGTEVYKNIDINGFLAHYLNALCIVSVNVYVLISAFF